MNDPVSEDLPETVRIGATRFEQSPYHACYANPQTLLGVAAGRFYPAYNGENTIETYWTLRRQAVLFDVPEKPWQIEGPDAVPFLERLFARSIASLQPGRGRYAIACTAEGGVFMDGILFRLDADCFWYVQPDGAFSDWVLAHKADFDVRVSDPGSRVLQIQGPASMQIMADATNGAIDESMKYFDAGHFDIGGQRLYVSRTGWTGELGYEIYSTAATTDHHRLWHHLFEAGAPQGMVFGSLAAMSIRRIEAGILDNLSDFDPTMTPFDAGLTPFIELEKHGFIGREALLKAERKPLLYGVKCLSTTPRNGDQVVRGEACVGQVTTGAWSPFLECGIGYIRFAEPADWEGRILSIQNRQGERFDCEIVTLPFYDREKRIPRGLDKGAGTGREQQGA